MDPVVGGGLKSIQIRRAISGGYGFSLMGGRGTEFPPVICDILEESPASKCGRILVGDTIVEINGESMSGQTTKQVVTALMKSPDELFLTLKEDEKVRQRLFEFLGHLDQPPGFSKGSWTKKERKVIHQDFRGKTDNGEVRCITEMTQNDWNNSRRTGSRRNDPRGLESASGPSSPPDSGYSTSVSTNGTADSLTSSFRSQERMRVDKLNNAPTDSNENELAAGVAADTPDSGRTTGGDGGSVFTTTAVVHSEHKNVPSEISEEEDVFYDAEERSSAADSELSKSVLSHDEVAVAPGSSQHSRLEVDGQCLSLGSQSECNSEGPILPSSPLSYRTSSGGSDSTLTPLDLTSDPESPLGRRLEKRDSVESDVDESSGSMSPDSINKHLDYPSAKRLAQRLYMLDGFKVTDVSMHLSKQNDFSQLVAEEYFSHYTFTGERVDQSLRKFLLKVAITGETQERERVLRHFSRRYHDCNGGLYQSESVVNTLTCALMLLNTDLHGKNNIGKKMTLNGFVRNMDGLNDGGDFPPETLKAFFQAIKSKPLQWAQDSSSTSTLPAAKGNKVARNGTMKLSGAPLLQMEADPNAPIYMKGYIMRKCIREADGKKPSRNKRKWKLFYGTVQGLILYLHKTEVAAEGNLQLPKEAISLHHCLAGKITEYKKKPHVFSLRLANWKEYVMQCTEQPAVNNWMQAMNLAAAIHSSPPLPAAVGRQKRFARPLLPSSSSKLSWQDQLKNHETKSRETEEELTGHRASPPDKTAKTTAVKDYNLKMEYLEYEVMRFKTYGYLLQSGPHPTIPEVATGPGNGNSNGGPTNTTADDGSQPVFRAQKRDSDSSDGGDSIASNEDYLGHLPVNQLDYSTHL